MKLPWLASVLFLGLPGFSSSLKAKDWVDLLKSPDVAVRRQAIDEIQTLDDARIPEACLPLLRDEGRSIRRQAARAIGSRYDQIAAERGPVFLKELRACATDGPEDTTFVAKRAIGLLTRKFDHPAFSVSPDHRWVLFEERRRPMIADVQLKHAQLMAAKHPEPWAIRNSDTEVRLGQVESVERNGHWLKVMATNGPLEQIFEPRWHPKGEAVALQPYIQWRFYRPVILWRAKDGAVTTWSVSSFKKLYGKKFPHWGTTTDFVEWRGSKAVIHIYDADDPGPPQPPDKPQPFDPKGILVSVDVTDWKIGLEK